MTTDQHINDLARKMSGNRTPAEMQEMFARQGSIPELAEITETERNYWHGVFADRPTSSALMITRQTAQEMEYDTARRKVWALMLLRAAHISELENQNFEWDMEPDFANTVRQLTKYFINDPSCEYPLTKGLFLYGLPGTGKTELMHIFERFTRENELSKAFQFSSLSKIYTDAKANADFDPVSPNVCFDRCFDEFGRYLGAVKRYGDDLDINEAIIEQRYERMKRYGQLTHLIANMTPNETENKFSPMLADRIGEMCTGVFFTGKSKRK